MEQGLITVLLPLTAIIVSARAASALARKAGQPGVCGEMAAGFILGPSLFGRFFPHAFRSIFDPSAAHAIAGISQIGVVLLVFLIGMEFQFEHLSSVGRKAIGISLAGLVVPFGSGLLLAAFMLPLVPHTGSRIAFCLFTATAISITALPTLGRMLIEFGLHRRPIGVTAITAAALDDAMGWTILAAIHAAARSNFNAALACQIMLETAAFAAILLLIVRPMLRYWAHRVLAREGAQMSFTTLTIILALVFGAEMITSRIGIFSVFGALMMGAVLFDQEPFRRALALRLRDFVYVFFVPVFFMYTGLRTDMATMTSPLLWELCLLVILVATVAKGGGSAIAARLVGFSWRESASLGALMNTRGLMELVVLNLGYDLGVIPKPVFFMLAVMALVTTYLTAPLLRRILGTAMEREDLIKYPTVTKVALSAGIVLASRQSGNAAMIEKDLQEAAWSPGSSCEDMEF